MSHGGQNDGASGGGAARAELARLLEIMIRLRDPQTGCPWDKEQTFATIAPFTVEEAHEVADAIERHDLYDLKDELGDLLFQVVFHARIAEEAGQFDFAAVAKSISDKMVRRHPHVFGDVKTHGAEQWEAIKRAERAAKAAAKGMSEEEEPGPFSGIAAGLPALLKSAKLQTRARRTGFDWPGVLPIFDKIFEELAELRVEIEAADSPEKHARQFEEFGDVMFVLVNMSLHLGIDAEAALRAANRKFERRMVSMFGLAKAAGQDFGSLSLDEMMALWDRVKEEERAK